MAEAASHARPKVKRRAPAHRAPVAAPSPAPKRYEGVCLDELDPADFLAQLNAPSANDASVGDAPVPQDRSPRPQGSGR